MVFEFLLDLNAYILSRHRMKFFRKIPIEKIKNILISNKSTVLLGLKIENEF